MSSVVHRPAIPYHGPIPGGLRDGKAIEIKGSVPHGADVFAVNLGTGLDIRADRPLHISVQLKRRMVVRNSLQGNKWGSEERKGAFPFIQGCDFTLTILVNSLCYFISVNGTHYCKFNHRLPMARVSTILIEGQVNIERIQFIDKSINLYQPQPQVYPSIQVNSGSYATYQPQPQVYPATQVNSGSYATYQPQPQVYPATQVNSGSYVTGYQPSPNVGTPACIAPSPSYNPYHYPSSTNSQPISNPIIPFAYPIPGGLRPGMMIYISGRPSLLFPHDFSINLQSSTATYPPPDIAFHFGVRHHNRTVVRNTRIGNVWEWEETMIPYFPFEAGVDFQLLIRVECDKYMVAINNNHLLEFRHRLQPLSHYSVLYIEKDVHISSVSFG